MRGQRGCPQTSAKAKGGPKNCPCACLEDLLATMDEDQEKISNMEK
jgi:hypothetical protein